MALFTAFTPDFGRLFLGTPCITSPIA